MSRHVSKGTGRKSSGRHAEQLAALNSARRMAYAATTPAPTPDWVLNPALLPKRPPKAKEQP